MGWARRARPGIKRWIWADLKAETWCKPYGARPDKRQQAKKTWTIRGPEIDRNAGKSGLFWRQCCKKCCSESFAHQVPRNSFQESSFLRAVGRRLGQRCPGAVKPANLATGNRWNSINKPVQSAIRLNRKLARLQHQVLPPQATQGKGLTKPFSEPVLHLLRAETAASSIDRSP